MLRSLLSGCALLVLAACVEDIRFAVDAGRSIADAGTTCRVELSKEDGFTPPTTAAQSCTSLFRHALCTCGDLAAALPIQTDAYDSSSAPYTPGKLGGSVGTNGRLSSALGLSIGGSLTVAGSVDSVVFVAAPSRVADNARLNAELHITTAELEVGRDLWVNGRILTLDGSLRVAHQIYQPASAENVGQIEAGAGLHGGQLEIDPPCPCANADSIDYALMAERFAANSDNLPSDALRAARELTIPCGRFLLAGSVVVVETQRWRAESHAVMFIDGDLELTAPVQVELGPRGQLDVFVRGSLILGPAAEVVTTRPAGLRFYVNGSAPIMAPTGAALSCSLYAPNAQLRTQSQRALFGAFVVSELTAPVPLAIHYDAAAQDTCDLSCAADDDCGGAWVCEAGRCVGVRP